MFHHLLLATDFSPPALLAAQTTATLARAFGSRVTLLHVVEPGGTVDAALRLDGLAALRKERFGHLEQVEFTLVDSPHPYRAIAEHADKAGADLIVAARHGEHELGERLLGTTTERLVRHAGLSVLVVHPAMREPLVLLKHVLVGTDFSESALRALTAAGSIARKLDAWVTVMHVYDLLPATVELLEEPYRAGEDHTLAAAMTKRLEAMRVSQLEGVPSEALLERDKSPVAGLCDYASNRRVDLMVLGTHGRTGLARFLLGSVAERVVRHAPCSVLVVR
jgi:nucleotide-binding universal stress UspA family protein